MLLDPRRPRLGWVSGDLVQAPHPSLRLTSAQNSQSEARAALSEDFLYWGAASYPVLSDIPGCRIVCQTGSHSRENL
jgi:hypothetical protein